VSKYVLMGASSNFGNMFSMAGATLILPFLPMLPIQILLNNLIYNVSEIAIPFDGVDPEAVVGPVKWDIKLIERFMLVFGPVSSVFDFVTFYAMLALFHAGEALFQTGWFVESMVTQTLVVFCIRTRRLFFRSKPGWFLAVMNIAAIAVAIVLPFVPWGVWFGFVAPPPLFFVFLVVDFLASALAFALERRRPDDKEDAWLLTQVWLQRFAYRQLFSVVLFKTLKRALEGRKFAWDKLERTAAVKYVPSENRDSVNVP